MLFGKKSKSSSEPKHELAKIIKEKPLGTVRSPWKLKNEFAVGGLHAIGFDPNSETLVVVSSNGQAIYDCITGERIYRNHENDGYDHKLLSARRLDQKESAPIPMSGIHGGGLRHITDDGWSLQTEHYAYPRSHLILVPPLGSLSEMPGTRYKQDFDVIACEYEFRVWGFSWSGNTFVWSDEADVRIYNRI